MSADRADAHRRAGAPAVAEDALLGGRVRLVQPAEGYRAAIDPVFLAAAVPAAAGEAVLDVGAGAGAAALCLAARVADVRVCGVEVAPDLVRLAVGNAGLNGLGGRVEFIAGDLLRPPKTRSGKRKRWSGPRPHYRTRTHEASRGVVGPF